MKVLFKDIPIDLKNETIEKNHFKCHWNGFFIDVEKEDGIWECYVTDHEGACVFDEFLPKGTLKTAAVQIAMNHIEKAVDSMEEESVKALKTLEMLRAFRSDKKEIKCPYCGSKKIFHFRLDSDWAPHAGNYSIANNPYFYTEEELKYDSFDRPDIRIYHCRECDALFK